jgi:DNA-binding PadR family transcriptional regulator
MALREVILTVLAHRRMTGYEISRNFDQVVSWFWTASHQQIYRELAKLNADGRVRFKAVRQSGKPDKKIYEITSSGRTELRHWLTQATPPPRPQNDLLVKMLAAASVGNAALPKEVARIQQVFGAVAARQRAMERECLGNALESPYDQTLFLALRLGMRGVDAQLAWLEEVQEYLKTGRLNRREPPSKN